MPAANDSIGSRIARAWHVLREGVDPFGGSIDPDEDLYRRISGTSRRDLTPIEQDRARDIAYWPWAR